MADGDVCFLDALRIRGGHIQQEIGFAGECAAGFAGECDEIGAARAASLHAMNDVRAGAAGGESYENVLRRDKRFDLARENAFEAVVVASGCENGRIGCEGQCGQAAAIGAQPYDKFGGEMQRIGGAPAIAKKNDFAAVTKSRCTFFNELTDASDELGGKALLNASAFLELASDFVGG